MGGWGPIVLGAGVASAIAALGGCAGTHGSATDPGPAGVSRAVAIGEARPLGEELSFAFKAGYHDAEQIWLRGVGGALARVSSWDIDPKYAGTCGESWSTLGYTGGRFGSMQLDARRAHLLFIERRQCHGARGEFPSRVLAHDLASGITRVLVETTVKPAILAGAGTAIVIVRRPMDGDDEPIPPGELELYEVTDGELEAIAVPRGDDWLHVLHWEGGHLLRFGDRTLLLVDGVPALERVDGIWQRSELGAPLAGADIRGVTGSPSETRLCAITSRVAPGGGRGTGVGWVLEPDGRWISAPLPDDPPFTCGFAPDESKVVFGSSFYALQDGELSPAPLAGSRGLGVRGTWRGKSYGTNVDGRSIARLDWSTLAIEDALTLEDLPALCADTSTSAMPRIFLPPDDRPLALVKASCGCTDCDISASLAWHIESGSVEMIEEVWGEHDVYGVAWLADGGAVVLSTQSKRGADGEDVLRPELGQYFLVSAGGSVETLGPLPDVEGVLHSPVSQLPFAR